MWWTVPAPGTGRASGAGPGALLPAAVDRHRHALEIGKVRLGLATGPGTNEGTLPFAEPTFLISVVVVTSRSCSPLPA